jgi:nicotinamidase/pyrazinamidase
MNSKSILLIIDVHNDFLPGGALAVPRGNEVIAVINAVAPRFQNVILTQDWHPADHVSFASSHYGKVPFETIKLPYGDQVLWPPHCIHGTSGAELAVELQVPHAQAVIRKGFHRHVDSYSAFFDADGASPTGLASLLRERRIETVYCCGLATDFCVTWSALHARNEGFETFVIDDACRGINREGSIVNALSSLTEHGVRILTTSDL